MGNRLTLEEQVDRAKVRDRTIYSEIILKAMDGEKTPGLYNALDDAPIFVGRDAIRLFAKIMRDEDNKHPTPEKYIRNSENLSAFVYLFLQNLVDIQEHRYLGIFKRRVIVSKERDEADYF